MTAADGGAAAAASTSPAAQSGELAACAAVFIPSDPPRTGQVAFWRPDGLPVPAATDRLTVVRPHGVSVRRRAVEARLMPVKDALALLLDARRTPGADPASAFWGAAAVVALQMIGRGRLLPGVSPGGFDAWRIGPLDRDDVVHVQELAAAIPREARAEPLPGNGPLELPQAEPLVRAFMNAVADALARTPAGTLAVGEETWAAHAPRTVTGPPLEWAQDLATGLVAGFGISLRIELPRPDLTTGGWTTAFAEERLTAVVQLHHLADGSLADAEDIWSGRATECLSAPDVRAQALLVLRRAARAWPPLGRLLDMAAPTALDLSDDEVSDLLGDAAQTLAAAGIPVHWPKELAKELLARAVVEPAEKMSSDLPSLLSAEALLSFRWQFTLGGRELDQTELDRIAQATRPLVRLRDHWVVIDPRLLARVRDREPRELTPLEALGAVLVGSADIAGERVPVTARGWLADLTDRLADPEATARRTPLPAPAALAATLRDYQVRGLTWLNQMTSLGLGGCLADDMGLGKTITLIALHLHRASTAGLAGPTLVVCPTSLMGNWQREIERFAPGTTVRRYHGTKRSLDNLETDTGFVLTTYATLRLRQAELAAPIWGMVVADEAQHVKNPSVVALVLATRTHSPGAGP
ncbi:SNF2-related protein [Streptomyces aureocirculatus]|uniref:SNF2-related protein n=1 Tax=Streptomyces aureocirculatus TaxID=67275 RepID=UPI003D33A50F